MAQAISAVGATGTTGCPDTLMLDEKEKRWIVVGMGMHKVLAPILRKFIDPKLKSLFCQLGNNMQQQNFNNYNKKDQNFKFLYESVNGNQGNPRKWNYCIQDHNEFAKLYMRSFMAKFSSVGDRSCDISALLTILCESSAFAPQQTAAQDVREEVRNNWGHCKMDAWDLAMYTDCFVYMKRLVQCLGLSQNEKKVAIDDLEHWEVKGMDIGLQKEAEELDLKLCIDTLTNNISEHETKVHEALDKFHVTREKVIQLDIDVEEIKKSVSQLKLESTSHDERLETHDKRLEIHDERLEIHDERLKEMKKDIEVNKQASEPPILLREIARVNKQASEPPILLQEMARGTKNWSEPNELTLDPAYNFYQYKTYQDGLPPEEKLDVRLGNEFFKVVQVWKKQNQFTELKGHLMFDFELNRKREDKMQIDAALLSNNVIKIIELVDNESCIGEANTKLEDRIDAIKKYLRETVKEYNESVISIKGVIVFPEKNKSMCTELSKLSNFSVLYKDQLLLRLFNLPQTSLKPKCQNVLDRMLDFSPKHTDCEEKAYLEAFGKMYCQSDDFEIHHEITFNAIKLSPIQESIKKELLNGNTLVCGSYGIGKTVAIVGAIKDLIKEYIKEGKKIKIMFLSAQSLLTDVNLKMSPFLLMIEQWIKQICLSLNQPVEIQRYTRFVDKNDDIGCTMRTDDDNGWVIFYLYILKQTDLKMINNLSITDLEMFDVIVLEETSALDFSKIEVFEKATKQTSHPKIWISSNDEKIDSILSCFKRIPQMDARRDNLRNVPAIANLAEAVNADIGPERFMSTTMSASLIVCSIETTYKYESNDEKRLNQIVDLAEKWRECKILAKSSILFIDCEDTNLHNELKNRGINVKMYPDQDYEFGEHLFLHNSDPVEAIVSGAEWDVLILHIKMQTMNSIRVLKLFNRRIISRGRMKMFIFSDRKLTKDKDDADEKNDKENVTSSHGDSISEKEVGQFEQNATETASEAQDIRPGNTKDKSSDDISVLIAAIHNHSNSSGEKLGFSEGYRFAQIRTFDKMFGNVNQDIYLVCGRERAFIMPSNSEDWTQQDVEDVHNLFIRIWNVKLPYYYGLIGYIHHEIADVEIERISTLLSLLKNKIWDSIGNDDSGEVLFSEDEVDQFTKTAKQQGKEKALQGLETNEELNFLTAVLVNQYQSLHPVKIVQQLQSYKEEFGRLPWFCAGFELYSAHFFKNGGNEKQFMKVHYIKSVSDKYMSTNNSEDAENILVNEFMESQTKDGIQINMEIFIRDSILSFPFKELDIFQRIKGQLDSAELGREPTALSILKEAIEESDSTDVEETEELDWIDSYNKTLITGKYLDDLERETGVRVLKRGSAVFLHGTKDEREMAKDIIRRSIDMFMVSAKGDDEIVDYIPDNLLGVIIGKRGSNIQRIFDETGASLAIREGKMVMTGSSKQRDLAHAAIKARLATCERRKIFATDKDAKYMLQWVDQTHRGNIYWLNPEDSGTKIDFNYENMPEFKKFVLEQIQLLNEKAKTKNAFGHHYLHVGKLTVCTKKEENETDVFTVDDVEENMNRSLYPWKRNLEGLVVAGLSPKKMANFPIFQSYIRYDFQFSTPSRSLRYRYKVYMKENQKESRMKFYKPEDLMISCQQCARRVGPGLLWNQITSTCRADILLRKEFVARFNIDTVYPEVELQDDAKEAEKNILIESFCNKLTVASIVDNDLPKLPNGYKVEYFRRCQRTEYDFDPNILVVSKEKEIVHKYSSESVTRQTGRVDIRLLSKELNRLLETKTWSIEEALDTLPDYFRFVGGIFDYLGT